MADCSKAWDALTPGEAARCVYGLISDVITKTFNNVSSVTIGDWMFYGMIAVWLPSIFGAFILPFVFIGRGIGRFLQHDRYEETAEGKGRWKFWSVYMFIAGVATFAVSKNDTFMICMSAVQVGCAAVQGIAGPSWWGRRFASDGRPIGQ
jgi:hypothetical protein